MVHVCGGSSAITSLSPVSAAPSTATALQSSATSLNGADAIQNASKMKKIVSSRQKYLRNSKALAKYVWPTVPKRKALKAASRTDLNSTMDANQKEQQYAMGVLILSIILMLLGKEATIATPFLFKTPAQWWHQQPRIPWLHHPLAEWLQISLPILLLLSCGLCHSLSSFFYHHCHFVYVAQSAIWSVGRSTFDHIHSLDLQNHLNHNTGVLSRVFRED
ncbi:LOW QUALITY PROTEIN: hypothetical protein ACHAWX_004029 [Stephanocyclus meneghinianus]